MKLATRRYWSRLPGKLVDPKTGDVLSDDWNSGSTGRYSVYEWYHTLMPLIMSIQDEFGIVKAISLDPESLVSIIMEVLINFRPPEISPCNTDEVVFGSLILAGTEIPLYKIDKFKTESLFLSIKDSGHVELVIIG